MRSPLTSTTVTSYCGHLAAITAIVGPPTWPAPMQRIRRSNRGMVELAEPSVALRAGSVSTSGRRTPVRLLRRSSTLLLDMREERTHLLPVQAQVGHADVFVLGEERGGESIAHREHPVGLGDVACQPGALTQRGHVQQIRTQPVALADAVAGGASGVGQVLTGFPFFQPKKSLIIVARNFGFSTAEFRIHSPVASFPTIKVG